MAQAGNRRDQVFALGFHTADFFVELGCFLFCTQVHSTHIFAFALQAFQFLFNRIVGRQLFFGVYTNRSERLFGPAFEAFGNAFCYNGEILIDLFDGSFAPHTVLSGFGKLCFTSAKFPRQICKRRFRLN